MGIRRNLRFTGIDYSTLVAGVSSGPAPTPTLTGITSFGASDIIATGSPGGVAGQAAGFYVTLVGLRTTLISSGGVLMNRMNSSFNAGWSIAQLSATNLAFCACSGAGAFIQGPAWTMQASDCNEIFACVGVHTGTQVKFFANRAAIGSPAAITGFTAASEPTTLGDWVPASGPPTEFTYYGVGGGHGAPSDADVLAWFDALKASGDVSVLMPNVPQTHIWPTNNLTSIIDGPGTDNMSITGTLTLSTMDPLVWGW
jgi:hypothetical protein